MQTTETDHNKNHTIRSDEEAINFRPSPNFKHMKKYLKSKFEESNSSTPNSHDDDSNDHNSDSKKEVSNIQPPLPPNPPPPDSPSLVKKEIEDEDYISLSPSEMSHDANKSETELTNEYKISDDGKENGEEIMCRNFIRGTCNRGASCIFAHKVILSQLKKVYRFCNDFQNAVCDRRNCNFVHATVFEREAFLRTAYLPPHTLSHLNKNTVTVQPPPPQPAVLPAAVAIPPAATIAGQAPPPIPVSVTTLPLISCAPAVGIDSRPTLGDVFRTTTATDATSLKREWADIDDFSSSPRDYECSESAAKKCKQCDINEFRLQFIKTKTKNLRNSNDELNKKIAIINSKGQRLLTVLATMIKLVLQKSKVPGGGGGGFLNMTEEKEQVLREQVALLSTVSAFSEENNTKNLTSGNPGLQSFLAKLLIGSMDPLLSPDGS